MSKGVLIGSLVACFLAVGLIAVLTPTVIANGDGDHGGRILRADDSFPGPGLGVPMPGPGRGGMQGTPGGRMPMMPGQHRMERCMERQGGALPCAPGPVPSIR